MNDTKLKESNIETIYGDGPFNPTDMYTYECKSGYKNTTYMVTCGSNGTWLPQAYCARSE